MRELGRRATIAPATIMRLEHGQHSPTMDTLERLAAALSVSIGDLVADRA
jgi:transcriptional regulator with XRE-family HTH domain